MKAPSTSISVYFDKRNMPTGRFQVKWSVYSNGKQKMYATGLVVDQSDVTFLKANKAGLSGRVKDERLRNLWNQVYGESYVDELTGLVREGLLYRARNVIAKIESYFTFEIFARVIAGDYTPEDVTPTDSDMIVALTKRAAELKAQGDISNASLHESTASSLRRFAFYEKLAKSVDSVSLPIMAITANFLKRYEKWMLTYGKAPQSKNGKEKPASITTVSIYTRYMRVIWNEAKGDKIVKGEDYPFHTKEKKKGYKIASVINKKKALNKDHISEIFEYKCDPGSPREKYRDLWLLVYMCNGINIMDLCKLRNSDYVPSTGIMEFFRDKTFDTKRDNMSKATIYLLPEAIQIIDKWRNENRRPEEHLFDFLPINTGAEEEKKIVNQVTWKINWHMRAIAKDLNFGFKVRVYEARHSFATALMNAGAPMKFIQDAFIHGSPLTTQKYLSSFDDENAAQYVAGIVPAKVRESVRRAIDEKQESQDS
ncbi:MAG: phage integrase SAM-like domain-containing protein [Dyadobacter sp.]|uniref:tyrosine-type recombinase/integrase n=1 Tax=Dyadobacter sp. TaxID=1914288 RepID=UPI001B2EB844|nr:phage integrase SAM-like domain-containing protein [Dyadobacter sp.]MBO9617345.1 phage integrase SAM-like domain-containing protein [Dyadobacter sp.]